MTKQESKQVIDDAKRSGREFGRIYFAAHGSLAPRKGPYSRDDNHTVAQYVEYNAWMDFQSIGVADPDGTLVKSCMKAARNACFAWRPDAK